MRDGSATDFLDVLLVEDDPALSEMYHLKLVDGGYQVRLANDGQSGLEAALQRPPDLLLLDLRLPNLSGFELLERLRRVPGWTNRPVIVLSNYGEVELIKRGQALGVLEHLIKSQTTPASLIETIRRLLPDGVPPQIPA